MFNKSLISGAALLALQFGSAMQAQEETSGAKWDKFTSNFSIQSDMLMSTQKGDGYGKWSGNSYITGRVSNSFLDLGIRFEDLARPLPGHEIERGRGIPSLYLSGTYKQVKVTLGDFYDQFGSGFVLRSYEDRNLGIDNAIRGGRLELTPYKGIGIKMLGGQLRNHFDRNLRIFNPDRGYLYGGDLELSLSDFIRAAADNDWQISLGSAFVSKHIPGQDIYLGIGKDRMRLNLPTNIPTWGARLNIGKGGFNIFGEYAHKINDPSAQNGYIYRDGSAAMLVGSYSKKGFSLLLGAKRSENFDSRAERNATMSDLTVNYLPAFTQQQTYTLAALHPYATQPGGEWAFQGEIRLLFDRNTPLGGKYGTAMDITASHVRGLLYKAGASAAENAPGGNGSATSFFQTGKRYFQDIDFHVYKKFSKSFSANFTYSAQIYNQLVVEKHTWAQEHIDQYSPSALRQSDNIYSHIFICDGKYKMSDKLTLRTELQYLHSRQAERDWVFALAELSVLPHLMFSLGDLWNIGLTQEHYYTGSVAYTHGAHRLQLSYGRTREGMNCSGGVCRLMPETKGVMLSYNCQL